MAMKIKESGDSYLACIVALCGLFVGLFVWGLNQVVQYLRDKPGKNDEFLIGLFGNVIASTVELIVVTMIAGFLWHRHSDQQWNKVRAHFSKRFRGEIDEACTLALRGVLGFLENVGLYERINVSTRKRLHWNLPPLWKPDLSLRFADVISNLERVIDLYFPTLPPQQVDVAARMIWSVRDLSGLIERYWDPVTILATEDWSLLPHAIVRSAKSLQNAVDDWIPVEASTLWSPVNSDILLALLDDISDELKIEDRQAYATPRTDQLMNERGIADSSANLAAFVIAFVAREIMPSFEPVLPKDDASQER
jgi:hypothetical protein